MPLSFCFDLPSSSLRGGETRTNMSQHPKEQSCYRLLKPLNSVELLLPGGRWGAQNWYVPFFRHQYGMLCFFFILFASSSSIIAFVADTQLCTSAIRTNTPCGARYVACHAQVELLLSFLGPPWSQWCSVRSWLFCNNGFWLRLFVARFWQSTGQSSVMIWSGNTHACDVETALSSNIPGSCRADKWMKKDVNAILKKWGNKHKRCQDSHRTVDTNRKNAGVMSYVVVLHQSCVGR